MGLIDKIKRIQLTKELNQKQEKINQLYQEEGLTDRVLDKQIELNTIRHQENISDNNQKIYKKYKQ